MYENASSAELSKLLAHSLAGGTTGASIDELSTRLLRAIIADRHPEAAELSLDWDSDGLSCGDLYDSTGAVISDFDAFDESYPEDLVTLASNVRGTGDVADLLVGPSNGPFRLQIR